MCACVLFSSCKEVMLFFCSKQQSGPTCKVYCEFKMGSIDRVLRVGERVIPFEDDPCSTYVCDVSPAKCSLNCNEWLQGWTWYWILLLHRLLVRCVLKWRHAVEVARCVLMAKPLIGFQEIVVKDVVSDRICKITFSHSEIISLQNLSASQLKHLN